MQSGADRRMQFSDHSDTGTEPADPQNVPVSGIWGTEAEKDQDHESDSGRDQRRRIQRDHSTGVGRTEPFTGIFHKWNSDQNRRTEWKQQRSCEWKSWCKGVLPAGYRDHKQQRVRSDVRRASGSGERDRHCSGKQPNRKRRVRGSWPASKRRTRIPHAVSGQD